MENITTNTARKASFELGILLATVKEPIIAPFVPEIIALCEKFGKSGQSGGSAPFTATALAQAIKKLCLQEPICDLTGIDTEWNDVSEMNGGEMLYQNNRCSALFKIDKPYYLEAIVWKDERGHAYTGTALLKDGTVYKPVYSRQYVKTFPFKPKTFYLDVISKEVAKDDWEFYIKDEKQLKKVFKYYNVYL